MKWYLVVFYFLISVTFLQDGSNPLVGTCIRKSLSGSTRHLNQHLGQFHPSQPRVQNISTVCEWRLCLVKLLWHICLTMVTFDLKVILKVAVSERLYPRVWKAPQRLNSDWSEFAAAEQHAVTKVTLTLTAVGYAVSNRNQLSVDLYKKTNTICLNTF